VVVAVSVVDGRPERYWEELDGSAKTGAVSRPPKHKRAGSENRTENRYTGGIEYNRPAKTTRLATKPGVTLREEALDDNGDGYRAKSWAETTDEWRTWLKETKETKAIFENQDGDEVAIPLENRFMKERQERTYAKFHDVARGAREEYGDVLTTVMLTFTASTKSGAGDWWRTPANHLDDLLASWPAVRRELHRTLDGRDWEYARVLEPHESGHAHVHLALFVRGPVRASAFEAVMEAHTENTLAAGWEAHRPDGDAVSVHDGRQNEKVENIAAYIANYVMQYGQEALDAPENEQRFNALLWATGRRRWSLSSGAQEWAAFEVEPAEDDWELTRIEVRGTEYGIRDGGEPVVRMELGDESAGLDPPPMRDGPP
jgi:hypothetical protein